MILQPRALGAQVRQWKCRNESLATLRLSTRSYSTQYATASYGSVFAKQALCTSTRPVTRLQPIAASSATLEQDAAEADSSAEYLENFLGWLVANGAWHLLVLATSSPRPTRHTPDSQLLAANADALAHVHDAGVRGIGQEDSKIALFEAEGGERGLVCEEVSACAVLPTAAIPASRGTGRLDSCARLHIIRYTRLWKFQSLTCPCGYALCGLLHAAARAQAIAAGDVVLEVPLRLALTDHPGDEESNQLLYEVRRRAGAWMYGCMDVWMCGVTGMGIEAGCWVRGGCSGEGK